MNKFNFFSSLIISFFFFTVFLSAQSLAPGPMATHSAALNVDGTVLTWGENTRGQLGNGETSERNIPIRVLQGAYSGTAYLGDDPNNKIISIALGRYFSIALSANGIAYTWGENANGQLGNNTTTNSSTPVKVLKGAYSGTTYLGDDPNNKIISVALGDEHSIALAADGTVYTWGNNIVGQLGNNKLTTTSSIPVKVLKGTYSGTAYLGDDPNNKIISVAVGESYSIALAADGTVYTWGQNFEGELGNGGGPEQDTPIKVLKGTYSGTTYLGDDPNNKIISVAIGGEFSIVLAADGTVYTWGKNRDGTLGNNSFTNSNTPIKVLKGAYSGTTYLGDDPNNKIISVALGSNYSSALAADGTAYTWGWNFKGELGNNTTTNSNFPIPVKVLKGAYSGTTYLGDNPNNKIISVSLGDSHSTALATDGIVYTWGENSTGQLGDGSNTDRSVPVQVSDVDGSGILVLPVELTSIIPQKMELMQNTPNPFNPSTSIRFSIPSSSDVTLKIYDLRGREVTTLLQENTAAGFHIVFWNGRNSRGRLVASGVYFYKLSTSSGFVNTKKMVLLK